ncbi:site-specific DNA-methyltransferase [Vibrio parahaemolyticus]|uniref:DNA methyltransferase n=1 Tax=Vibrio parahaemolyticus TaxID=670 RepID=UPI001EF846F7|nr:site-specific DNA-methyltransferase [Vibrio parahaemolyticus]MCG7777277.1 site-specific DNA-methyltransferase [Vibrio parahaemolyticus]HCE3509818.1 site-specific DNA-methyltransferase [Vibrio parahaemolyticus]HCH4207432.1 site-specific DNA-methyltransferase [Vibrio parahaemolyticus]HCH6053329.1 site-specific DNA-methyltransferase [Vibrio parahaemolyticus]HCM0886578.1 site-specific DNA-methyltransferase [Vibrio parahaemolyticus]
MLTILSALTNALQADDRLVIDGKLAKNKIVELALNLDPELLKLLLADEHLKKHFFKDIDGVLIFDKVAFQRFVNNKSFLPDSYTEFKNKIGLSDNSHYLAESNDIVLAWPYKDCVLEGGQTKEDQKRNEIFWNETLAPEQVDTLLAPKALANFKKFDSNGEHTDFELSQNDNLVIKGNNLLALHSLKKSHTQKVKLIYIDPPYNTENDGFQYNDRFNHSTWLTFMKNRLEAARELLSSNGLIAVQITDIEHAYLRVMMDEIYGKDNFISTIIWKKRSGAPNDKTIGATHEYIILFAKNIDQLAIYKKARSEEQIARYKNPDNHPKGPWAADNLMANVKGGRYVESLYFPIVNPNTGEEHYPSSKGNWRYNKEQIEKLLDNKEIYFGVDGNGRPKLKRFLCDLKSEGVPYGTIWDDVPLGTHGTKEILGLFGTVNEFDTAKPEGLMKALIDFSTIEDDIVLDFFGGSGTTAAVAHKTKRKYITCEQMDYISTVTIPRLKKVIEGEPNGISKDVNWQGGGSFVYCELADLASRFSDLIEQAQTTEQLIDVWNDLKNSANLSYKVDPALFDENREAFNALEISEQKKLLIEFIDKNQLYVNYSEIDDKTNEISENDKKLNKQFYGA